MWLFKSNPCLLIISTSEIKELELEQHKHPIINSLWLPRLMKYYVATKIVIMEIM